MDSKLKAHLALLAANIIYGANYTIAKLIMPDHIKPFGFVLLRVLGGLILFGATDLLFVKQKMEPRDLPKIALIAVFGVAINQLFFLKGLSLTSPISAAIMMISTPIIVLIMASIFIKEKITLTKTIGILSGFTGALLLISYSGTSNLKDGMWGNVLVLINALAWGAYMVMVKPLMKKYNTVLVLKWVFFFGLIMVLPFGINEFTSVEWAGFSTQDWLSAAFVVICTTYIAYLLNTFALGALSASVVSAYIYIQPVLAALIALSFGKDELSVMKIVCALLIITGVYLVSKPQTKRT